MTTTTEKLFETGRLVVSPGAEHLPVIELAKGLGRHKVGDWGDILESERAFNDAMIGESVRLISAYETGAGEVFWIITAADRSNTTILLPSEYK
jgi:hypothetical protein